MDNYIAFVLITPFQEYQWYFFIETVTGAHNYYFFKVGSYSGELQIKVRLDQTSVIIVPFYF